MTHESISEAADYMGFGTTMLALSAWFLEHLSLASVNDAVQTFVGLGGGIWVTYKVILIRQQIKGQKLDNRKKELEIEFKQKDND